MPALYGYSEGYFQKPWRHPARPPKPYEHTRHLNNSLDLKDPLHAYPLLREWNETLAEHFIQELSTWPRNWGGAPKTPHPNPIKGKRLWLDKTALLVMGTDVELKESLPRQGLSAIVSENPLGIHHVSIKNKKEKRIILSNIAPLSQYWGVEASFPGRITVIKNPNVYEAGRDYRWHTLTPHTIKSTDPTKPSGFTFKWLADEVIDKAHDFEPWYETFDKKKQIRWIDAERDKFRGAPAATRNPPDPT
jgi:hypothetical protein